MKKVLFPAVLLLCGGLLAALPDSIVMESGSVKVRLDARKRWNINRIEWKGQLVCIDTKTAHYGMTCRPAGSPHFIGSGHAESGKGEEVSSVRIFADGVEVTPGNEKIVGKTVGMEKISKIHEFLVKYSFEIKDDVLSERTEIFAEKDVPLRQLYCFMHPWSTRFTDFHMAGSDGKKEDGTFLSDEKHRCSRFVPAISWYDRKAGIIVSTVVEEPSFSKNLQRLLWDRRWYRKDYICLVSNGVFTGRAKAVCRVKTGFRRQKDAAEWTADADDLCGRLQAAFSDKKSTADGLEGKAL